MQNLRGRNERRNKRRTCRNQGGPPEALLSHLCQPCSLTYMIPPSAAHAPFTIGLVLHFSLVRLHHTITNSELLGPPYTPLSWWASHTLPPYSKSTGRSSPFPSVASNHNEQCCFLYFPASRPRRMVAYLPLPRSDGVPAEPNKSSAQFT